MSTGYYGLDNPNYKAKQNRDGWYWGYQERRRDNRVVPASGLIVVHTAEVPPDYSPPDHGAENTARYFTQSTRAASYHLIADSDSIVPFLPLDHTAFHDATGTNHHSIGVSMGTQAHTWGYNLAHDQAILANAATAIALAWRYTSALHGDNPLDYGWVTPDQARAYRPGLVEHGELDASRRGDPWTRHPHRAGLRSRLLALVRERLAHPTQEEVLIVNQADEEKVRKIIREELKGLILTLTGSAGVEPGSTKDVYNLRTVTRDVLDKKRP